MVDPALFPFQSHYCEINDLKLHFLDEGDGPPVVMVHGNPTWSFYYRNLVLALRDRYRTIVPDHIGMGLSEKPGDDLYDYTLSQRVDDLEILLDQLNIKQKITLVLHDWGGMIGMTYASRYPDRIHALVVMNTAAFLMPDRKKFPFALKLCRDTGLGAFLVRGFNAFSAAAARVGCKRHPLSREIRKAYTEPYDSWSNRIATLRFVQDIPLEPHDRCYALVEEVQQGLSRFADKPMLICWGAKDFVFSDEFLDEWRGHFPNARVHRFADAGHYILEDAAEEVVPLIGQFIDQCHETARAPA